MPAGCSLSIPGGPLPPPATGGGALRAEGLLGGGFKGAEGRGWHRLALFRERGPSSRGRGPWKQRRDRGGGEAAFPSALLPRPESSPGLPPCPACFPSQLLQGFSSRGRAGEGRGGRHRGFSPPRLPPWLGWRRRCGDPRIAPAASSGAPSAGLARLRPPPPEPLRAENAGTGGRCR